MKKVILGIIIIINIIFGINNLYSYTGPNGENLIGPEEAPKNNQRTTGDGLESSTYMIDTQGLGLTKGNNINTGGTAKETVELGLKVIVEKLMVAFGVLALFIMTIGGGYMIFAAGQDELLNKGKSIFNSGLIALAVALGSGIIMKIIISLLY